MREFGSSEEYSLSTIIGWLESQIENEAEKASGSEHDKARLDCAYDALDMLSWVDEWTPRITREYRKQEEAKRRLGKA